MKYKDFRISVKNRGAEGYIYYIWKGEEENLVLILESGDFFASRKLAIKDAKLFIDKELV